MNRLRTTGTKVHNCLHCNEFFTYTNDSIDPDRYSTDTLCPRCALEYEYCRNCGNTYRKSENAIVVEGQYVGCCHRCVTRIVKQECLKGYSYKPEPKFKKIDSDAKSACNYMGLEFEVELGTDEYEAVDLAYYASIEGMEEWIYAKTDGSLDDGVEFVTHPITYKSWIKEYLDQLDKHIIQPISDKIIFKPDTAGIHIHVNRACLGTNPQKRNETMYKIMYLLSIPDNFEKARKYCQRSNHSMGRWSRKYDFRHSYKQGVPLNEQMYIDGERYHILNICNRNTVEFRCFASVANIVDIKAFFIFANNVIEYCKRHTEEEIAQTDIVDVMLYKERAFIKDYIKTRRIDIEIGE